MIPGRTDAGKFDLWHQRWQHENGLMAVATEYASSFMNSVLSASGHFNQEHGYKIISPKL